MGELDYKATSDPAINLEINVAKPNDIINTWIKQFAVKCV